MKVVIKFAEKYAERYLIWLFWKKNKKTKKQTKTHKMLFVDWTNFGLLVTRSKSISMKNALRNELNRQIQPKTLFCTGCLVSIANNFFFYLRHTTQICREIVESTVNHKKQSSISIDPSRDEYHSRWTRFSNFPDTFVIWDAMRNRFLARENTTVHNVWHASTEDTFRIHAGPQPAVINLLLVRLRTTWPLPAYLGRLQRGKYLDGILRFILLGTSVADMVGAAEAILMRKPTPHHFASNVLCLCAPGHG